MANCGNFLEYAGSKCGIDVGYGKMILVYPEKTSVTAASLTAEEINASIIAGRIVGVVKGWHTIAGAPVAEVSVERTGTSEMKLIRAEIAADTLSFESNFQNREILGDLVKAGSLNCLLIDDQGNVFGDASTKGGELSTMLLNFSSKVSGALQGDNVTDKVISITVRYLVKDLDVLFAETETELIASKSLLSLQLVDIDTLTATSIVMRLLVKNKGTGKAYTGAIGTGEVTVTGAAITTTTGAYVPSTGILTVTLAGTGFITLSQILNITVSGKDFYSKETQIAVRLGE